MALPSPFSAPNVYDRTATIAATRSMRGCPQCKSKTAGIRVCQDQACMNNAGAVDASTGQPVARSSQVHFTHAHCKNLKCNYIAA